MAGYEFLWDIMMFGGETTEKTSLVKALDSPFFPQDHKLTIGVDFYTKTTEYKGRKVKLKIWDLSSEHRFRHLLHQYVKGANAALLLFNITNRLSLNRFPEWTQIIRNHVEDIPIMLVGTKLHLAKQRAVTKEDAIQVVQPHNVSGYIEVSSKTGQNVEKLFDIITEILFDRYRPTPV